MPFDERVLPPELESLAEQLSVDSARLASIFPAPRLEGGADRPAAARSSSWIQVAAAASIAVAIGWLLAGDPDRPVLKATIGASPGAQTNRSAAVLSKTVSEKKVQGDLQPAVWFHGLSAPEQEAALDLLEQDSQSACRLSI